MSQIAHDAWDLEKQQPDERASLWQKLRFAVQCAMLAPSSHNSQPWHFLINGDSINLCADRMRALPVVDPYDRELVISCGAALFNLRVALHHLGLAYEITPFPSEIDPDVLAHVRVAAHGSRGQSLAPLFSAITARKTVREPFESTPVAQDVKERLVEAGESEWARVCCIDDTGAMERIAELIGVADARQFADPRFRRELASWMHPHRSNDGMPSHIAGTAALLDFAAPVVPLAIRTFDLGNGVAAMHHKLVAGSPLLVVIATDGDNREAWLAAGQALERMLLTAAGYGLSASYLNQPIEVDPLRDTLRALTGVQAMPQLLLRIGHGPAAPAHSPRRPLSDILW